MYVLLGEMRRGVAYTGYRLAVLAVIAVGGGVRNDLHLGHCVRRRLHRVETNPCLASELETSARHDLHDLAELREDLVEPYSVEGCACWTASGVVEGGCLWPRARQLVSRVLPRRVRAAAAATRSLQQ